MTILNGPKYDFSIPTDKECTTLSEYKNLKKEMGKSRHDNSDLKWFPDTSDWENEELQRLRGDITIKPGSSWSVGAINEFFYRVDTRIRLMTQKRGRNLNLSLRASNRSKFKEIVNKKVGKTIIDDGIETEVDLGLPTHMLIELANLSFGYNNWMSKTASEQLIWFEEIGDEITSLCFKIRIKVILADGTNATKEGIGYAFNSPSYSMAFGKAKKEAVTDGVRKCFYSLIQLLLDYEEKIKNGYFTKYE